METFGEIVEPHQNRRPDRDKFKSDNDEGAEPHVAQRLCHSALNYIDLKVDILEKEFFGENYSRTFDSEQPAKKSSFFEGGKCFICHFCLFCTFLEYSFIWRWIMILKFSVENYGLFQNQVTLDLTCGCYKEHLDDTAPFGDNRYNKMVAVFGPNASGKTTLVRALTNLKNMLRLENGGLRKGLLPFNPFAFEDGSDQPTLYHIVFTKDHVLFDYLLMFSQDAITYESLHYAPKGRRKLVFERSENHYTFGAFPEDLNTLVLTCPKNQLFLKTANTAKFKVAQKAFGFLVNDVVTLDKGGISYLDANDEANVERILEDKSFLIDFLHSADIEVTDIEVGPNRDYDPQFPKSIDNSPNHWILSHANQGITYGLPLEQESAGTQQLIALALAFKQVFDHNGSLVLDEPGNLLHPAVLKGLIRSFPVNSAPESQLIFTTHNTAIMCDELFRRDQIWFLNKDNNDGIELISLADFQVRPTDNYERDYLLGRYGAVPAVITFLKDDRIK